MKLFIAGGNHQDPLCRHDLVMWLQEIQQAEQEPPRFVAVEWSQGGQGMIEFQRPAFVRIAGGLLGNGTQADLTNRLAMTIAWEVDSHRAVFGDVPPTYLDPPSRQTSRAINAGLYLDIFRQRLLGFAGDVAVTQDVLQWIRDRCIEAGQNDVPDFPHRDLGREQTWLDRLEAQHAHDSPGWGVAVVGALHASTIDPNTFRTRSANAGYVVQHRYLQGWDPDA